VTCEITRNILKSYIYHQALQTRGVHCDASIYNENALN